MALRGDLVVGVLVVIGLVVLGWLAEGGARPALSVGAGAVTLLTPAPWPVPVYVSVVVGLLLSREVRAAARRVVTLQRPHLRVSTIAMAAVVAVVCWALASWQLRDTWTFIDITQPNVAIIISFVIAASAFNAAAEELVWRVFLYEKFKRQSIPMAVAATALSFGLSHWEGLPGGWPGMLSAALFGVILGILRSRGMLGSCLFLHFCADAALLAAFVSHVVFRQ